MRWLKLTTYEQIHKSLDCPYCEKELIISRQQDQVACQNPKCDFNNNDYIIGYDIASSDSKDASCFVKFKRNDDGTYKFEGIDYM